MGRYFSLFSKMTQISTADRTSARGKPDDNEKAVSTIPAITGQIIIAPNALNLGIMIRKPPTISATPTRGSSYLICIKAPNMAIAFCGISLGEDEWLTKLRASSD
ncbi:hypothetical protein [Arcticibacter sp. MXS-1]|uniref:hypothetical protein n=1 Tax=Arcticibacter sp. MXS-1 TaxID=3341726 RepID=UPI0035A95837